MFDFSTLITDRAAADLENLRALLSTPVSDWTAEQLAQFNQAISKGAYNYTDLNRVTACMEYLDETLKSYGYETGYQKIEISHQQEPSSPLPDGYTLLEYIESTGTQWINTGVVPGQTDFSIEMDVQSTADASAENWFMTMNQAMPSGGGATFLNVGIWSSKFALHLTGITVDGLDPASTDRKTVTLNVQGSTASLTVDNVYTVNNSSFSTGSYRDYPITFFTELIRGYAFKIYVGGELVRDYVPCVNPAREIGLYDLVNTQFYGNSGTGVFSPGPEITPGPDPSLDPYTWYEDDVPTASQMAQYINNVLSIWSTIMGDPTLPETMVNLTQEGANQIEAALIEINTAIEQIIAAMARSNSFTFWSGNRPFPTAYSNRGRNWAELDAMHTTWRNWQVANWYLLLYGNLEAEGDVT